MSLARKAALALLAVIAVGLVFALHGRQHEPLQPRPAAKRPVLLLVTSLPLIFGEGFSLHGGGSPALSALQSRYRVVPVGVTDPTSLAKGKLLLMAHPLAQPAEDLVALDAWVRGGGRLLLLADPMLEWPSQRPLGDPLRPPPIFMDTGLLAHWGLRLDPPAKRGPAVRKLGGFDVLTVSPGALSGSCDISPDRLLADCRIGRGRAVVLADADFLDVQRGASAPSQNLEALLTELARIEAK